MAKSEQVRAQLAAVRARVDAGEEEEADGGESEVESEAEEASVTDADDDDDDDDDDRSSSTSAAERALTASEELRNCRACGRLFGTRKQLTNHKSDKHGPMKPCRECDYSTPKKSDLTRHVNSVHRGIKEARDKQPCPSCRLLFDPSALIRHKRTHTNEAPYTCPYCLAYAAKQSGALDRHINSQHMKRRLFCLVAGCDKSYADRSGINYHLKNEHNKSAPYTAFYELRDTDDSPPIASLAVVRQVQHSIRAKSLSSTANDDAASVDNRAPAQPDADEEDSDLVPLVEPEPQPQPETEPAASQDDDADDDNDATASQSAKRR
ncbi:MAG TPA: C2H2-type zinc finger protein, partial [Gammaproteobacteria bacterium]|nr:C2H2-type zinc finger protein [Gammaproteobacteria bacterium]